tara:strand:+ start:2446 stop:2910 length:465 start_codon:yes stop_codon:yes gene_type:complete
MNILKLLRICLLISFFGCEDDPEGSLETISRQWCENKYKKTRLKKSCFNGVEHMLTIGSPLRNQHSNKRNLIKQVREVKCDTGIEDTTRACIKGADKVLSGFLNSTEKKIRTINTGSQEGELGSIENEQRESLMDIKSSNQTGSRANSGNAFSF